MTLDEKYVFDYLTSKPVSIVDVVDYFAALNGTTPMRTKTAALNLVGEGLITLDANWMLSKSCT